MERETLLLILTCAFFAATMWLGALVATRTTLPCTGSEHCAWRRLVAPVFIGLLPVFFLLGWALREPDPTKDWPNWKSILLAAVTAFIGLRALWRAWSALASTRRTKAPIATVGIFHSRILVSTRFARMASPAVLSAARAHESAHIRARDPLRIWLGQFLADLQWPLPDAHKRFRAWLYALELRRDDEAIAMGANPSALAEAILLVVRIGAPTAHQGAQVTGDGFRLISRIRRLLSGDIQPSSKTRSPAKLGIWILCALSFAVTLWLGFAHGQSLVPLLPGVMQ